MTQINLELLNVLINSVMSLNNHLNKIRQDSCIIFPHTMSLSIEPENEEANIMFWSTKELGTEFNWLTSL